MIVATPKETAPGERRVALVPPVVRPLLQAGIELRIERGAGLASGWSDEAYEKAGFRVEADRAALLQAADVVTAVQAPEVDSLRPGSTLIGMLQPLDRPELAAALAGRGVDAFAMELMPRITRAQSMDALSSMATVAGYRAVLLAAVRLPKMFPMLTTAAGTVSPARVLVIGAGVAGLQAIATARRLGAVVEAYDMRPAVREQVQSLGARFVELDLETEDAEDASGYARAQSEEFYQRQRDLLGVRVRAADVVITTAQVPGARAPRLIEAGTVASMKRGSVIVDLAAGSGGNCDLTRADEEVVEHGVTVLGPTNLPAEVPVDASQMYARNITTFIQHLAPEGELVIDLEDEITRGALLVRGGEIANERVRQKLQESG